MIWDIRNECFLNANQFSALREIFNRLGHSTLGPLDDGFISTEGYHYWGLQWARPVEDILRDLEDLASIFGYRLVPGKPIQNLEERAAHSPFKQTILMDDKDV